jgi:hypothetical protein
MYVLPQNKPNAFIGLLFIAFVSMSQAKGQDICLKIGNNYFINCKSVLTVQGHSVLNMTGNDSTGRKVSFEMYTSSGKLDARLENGIFTGTQAQHYKIEQDPKGFHIYDDRDNRVLLKAEGHYNDKAQRKEVHIWAQLYLPNGSVFECTPETSNVPTLQMMSGNVFRNSGSAVTID